MKLMFLDTIVIIDFPWQKEEFVCTTLENWLDDLIHAGIVDTTDYN
jgi:hypothetical protein